MHQARTTCTPPMSALLIAFVFAASIAGVASECGLGNELVLAAGKSHTCCSVNVVASYAYELDVPDYSNDKIKVSIVNKADDKYWRPDECDIRSRTECMGSACTSKSTNDCKAARNSVTNPQILCNSIYCGNTEGDCKVGAHSLSFYTKKVTGSCTSNDICAGGSCKGGNCCYTGGLSDGCTECWSHLGTCRTCAAPYILDYVTQSCKVPKYGACTANSMCESGSCKGGNCCQSGGLSNYCTECLVGNGECKVCSAPYSLTIFSGECELLSSPPPPSPPPPPPSPLSTLYSVSSSATMISTTAAVLIGFSYIVASLTLK